MFNKCSDYETYADNENPIKHKRNKNSGIINLNNIKKLKFDDVNLNNEDYFEISIDYASIDANEASLLSYSSLDFVAYKFGKSNGYIPDVYKLEDMNTPLFINDILDNFNIPKTSYYKMSIQSHDTEYKNNIIISSIISFKKDLILFQESKSEIVLFYNRKYEEDKNSLLYKIIGLIKGYKRPKVVKNKIYVVYRSKDGFDKKGFDIKKTKINLNENYNDDFLEISKKIIEGLNDKNKSNLVLLHGEPGVGKTWFLRYLTSKLKKNIIFVSPDMVNYITDPSFIPFLIDNDNSILVIEDAEPALQTRGNDGRAAAVSNVLNLTDGLLSDCLNISIIATFNTKTKNIDEALLRKGRLLMNYGFEKLDKNKSTKLLNKLGFNKEAKDNMTLAEIYNYETDNNIEDLEKRKTGFIN